MKKPFKQKTTQTREETIVQLQKKLDQLKKTMKNDARWMRAGQYGTMGSYIGGVALITALGPVGLLGFVPVAVSLRVLFSKASKYHKVHEEIIKVERTISDLKFISLPDNKSPPPLPPPDSLKNKFATAGAPEDEIKMIHKKMEEVQAVLDEVKARPPSPPNPPSPKGA